MMPETQNNSRKGELIILEASRSQSGDKDWSSRVYLQGPSEGG